MCDYSLMEYNSRLATDGDQLEVHRFTSGSLGLVSAPPDSAPLSFWKVIKAWWKSALQQAPVVVCIPPGTRLRVYNIPDALQDKFAVAEQEDATFAQLHADTGTHRDAIRFDQGPVISLQELSVGQRVEVLSSSLADDVPEPLPAELIYPEY